MANVPKRVAVIGLDAAILPLIEKHTAEGYLPTFKKLMERGVLAENCLAPFPTITPPNWTAIATGAFGGTNGVTDFHYHQSGSPLDNRYIIQDWNSGRVLAETIWEALDKAGKKCIVLNYPCSWPPKEMKNGIMVGGAGFVPGEIRDGLRHDCVMVVSGDQLITTGIYPKSFRGEFREATGWKNVEEMGAEPLEMEVKLPFTDAQEMPAETTWYVLVRQSGGDGKYDRSTLSPSKDFKDAFCTLGVGEWSSRVVTRVKMKDGSEREVFFRCKLIELSEDAEDFRLLIGAMPETTGWSYPPGVAKELVSGKGSLHTGYGMYYQKLGIVDIETFMEMGENGCEWLGDAAVTLMKNHEWDLFIMHEHTIDFMYHVVMSDLDSPDEEIRRRAWALHLRALESNDRMLAKIVEAVGPDTLVVLVADHGAVPDGPVFDPYDPLMAAGLTALTTRKKTVEEMDGVERMRAKLGFMSSIEPDYQRCKAIPQRSCYVYVNLKGRDPGGIVEPADYEKVQQEIIDALYGYVDPKTGQRPVALALTKRDARLLGMHGDRVGDVVYATQPWFGSQHGVILPTAQHGSGRLNPLLLMAGPGLKKKYRMERTCWLTDLVPTLCYLMDWPVPNQTEGSVMYQAFEDPNFQTKEIQQMKNDLAQTECALQNK